VSWHVAQDEERHSASAAERRRRDPRNRIIMRPVVDSNEHVLGVAGVIFDEDLVRCAMLNMGRRSLAKHYNPDMDSLRLLIGEHLGRHGDLKTQPLGFVLTNWRLGVKDGATPGAARRAGLQEQHDAGRRRDDRAFLVRSGPAIQSGSGS
jgi:hypothetical protein